MDVPETATAATSLQSRPMLQPPRLKLPAAAAVTDAAAVDTAASAADSAAGHNVAAPSPQAAGKTAAVTAAAPDVGPSGGDITVKNTDEKRDISLSTANVGTAVPAAGAAVPAAAAAPLATTLASAQANSKLSGVLPTDAPAQALPAMSISSTPMGSLDPAQRATSPVSSIPTVGRGSSQRVHERQLPHASLSSAVPLLSQTQQAEPSLQALARIQQQAILVSSKHLIGVLTPDSPSSGQESAGLLPHVAEQMTCPEGTHHVGISSAGTSPVETGTDDVSLLARQQRKRKAPDAAGKNAYFFYTDILTGFWVYRLLTYHLIVWTRSSFCLAISKGARQSCLSVRFNVQCAYARVICNNTFRS